MHFRTKIILILAVAIVAIASLSIINYVMFYDLDNEVHYTDTNINEFIRAEDLNNYVLRYDNSLLRYVTTENPEWLAESEKLKGKIQVALQSLDSAGDEKTKSQINQLRTKLAEYFGRMTSIVKSSDKKKNEKIRAFTKEYNERLISISNAANQLVEQNETDLSQNSRTVTERASRVKRIGIYMTVIFIPLLAGLLFFVYRTSTTPIMHLVKIVSDVSKEVDDNKLDSLSTLIDKTDAFAKRRVPNDELGLLARTFRNLAKLVSDRTKELSDMTSTDEKTKLKNFRFFKETLQEEIKRAIRFNRPLSVIMIDVDKFKHYNDTNGHMLGDEALIKVAKLMKQECRETDVPARFGGEEFSVILPESDKLDAVGVAERIRRAIEETYFINQEAQPAGNFTASLGVATFPHDATDEELLLKAADAALYEAKEKGRNRVVSFLNLEQESPNNPTP